MAYSLVLIVWRASAKAPIAFKCIRWPVAQWLAHQLRTSTGWGSIPTDHQLFHLDLWAGTSHHLPTLTEFSARLIQLRHDDLLYLKQSRRSWGWNLFNLLTTKFLFSKFVANSLWWVLSRSSLFAVTLDFRLYRFYLKVSVNFRIGHVLGGVKHQKFFDEKKSQIFFFFHETIHGVNLITAFIQRRFWPLLPQKFSKKSGNWCSRP